MKYILFPFKFVVFVAFKIICYICVFIALPFVVVRGITKVNEDPVRASTKNEDVSHEIAQEITQAFYLDVLKKTLCKIEDWTFKDLVRKEDD